MRNRNKIEKILNSFISEFDKSLSKIFFLCFGSALTIFRDGKHGDDDIDFALNRKFLPNAIKFIKDNQLNVMKVFRYHGQITEITIKYQKVNIDFFVIDNYEGITGTIEYQWTPFSKKITSATIFDGYFNDSIKLKKYKGINYIADQNWFKNVYGVNWNKKLLGNDYRIDKKNHLTKRNHKIIKSTELLGQNYSLTKKL